MVNVFCTLFVVTCFVWSLWIFSCDLAYMWATDLIQYETQECIPFDSTAVIALLSVASFNGLLLLISLFVFFTKYDSIYKPLSYVVLVTSVAQLGVHITVFISAVDLYWFAWEHEATCNYDEETIEVVYLFLFIGLIIASLFVGSVFISCIYGGVAQYYFPNDQTGSDGPNEMNQLIQSHSKARARSDKEDRVEGHTINPFRGTLDWTDYKALYNEDILTRMVKNNEFPPIPHDMYFLSIEIQPQKAAAFNVKEYKATLFGDDEQQELNGNKLPFQVAVHDNDNGEHQQEGYALYNEDNDMVQGIHRMVFETRDAFVSLDKIKFRIANSSPQTLTFNHDLNDITLDDEYTASWEQNADINISVHKDIKESQIARFKNVILYFERITTYSSMRFPNREQTERFYRIRSDDPECKQVEAEFEAVNMPILYEAERNMQVYYNPYKRMVYGVNNVAADTSATHCGFGDLSLHSCNEHCRYFDGFEYAPYYFQNITQPFFMCCRYHYQLDYATFGAELNVFKSLCFIPPLRETRNQLLWERMSLAIIVLMLQLFMMCAVLVQVWETWSLEEMFDDDRIIITLSFVTFGWLSYSYWFTVYKFYKFYECMYYICDVDFVIPILDFISNIMINIKIIKLNTTESYVNFAVSAPK